MKGFEEVIICSCMFNGILVLFLDFYDLNILKNPKSCETIPLRHLIHGCSFLPWATHTIHLSLNGIF